MGLRSSDRISAQRTLLRRQAFTARGEEEFREALKKGLAANAPVVIEAVLDPAEYDVII